MGDEEGLAYIGACVCCIGVLLMLILLPMSFAAISEEELGLQKHSISKKVSFDEIYFPGHHNTGPSYSFEKVNRHVHGIQVKDSSAWTCPIDDDGNCIADEDMDENVIGQQIYTTFTILFRLIQDKENVQKAYQSYQFNDASTQRAVKSLATENSKQNPQQYSLTEIINAHIYYNVSQVIVDADIVNQGILTFGYEIFDVIVTEIDVGDAIAKRYLNIEINRYEDEIIRVTDQANEVYRNTSVVVEGINNEGTAERLQIESYANALEDRLVADIGAYRRDTDRYAITEMIEMLKVKFPNSGVTDIMAMTTSLEYMDQLLMMGRQSGVEKVFIDQVNALNIQT